MYCNKIHSTVYVWRKQSSWAKIEDNCDNEGIFIS